MDINFFKDTIFDLVNESDELDVTNIITDDKTGMFIISVSDGSEFELRCSQVK